jgi:tyrosyl-tRNA synthetase
VEQGGVKVDGEKVTDRNARVGAGTFVVQVGKRKWARVTVR